MTKFVKEFDGHEIVSKITENALYSLFEGDKYLGFMHPMFSTDFYDPIYGLMWKTSEFRDHMVFHISSNKTPEMAYECKSAIDRFVEKHKQAVLRIVAAYDREQLKKKYKIRVFMELSTLLLQDGRVGKKFQITSSLVTVDGTGSVDFNERAEKLALVFTHSTRKL